MMGRLMTVSEVAAEFGVAAQTVRRWAAEGELTCTWTLGGQRRFDPAEVERKKREGRR